MNIDPTQSRQVLEIKHESPLLCCAVDAAGRFVLAGGRDRGLVCVDVATSAKTILEGHESWIGAAARASSDMVLTADYVGHLVAWDCGGERPQPRWNIPAQATSILALAVSGDGKLCATGDREGSIRVWHTSDGKLAHELPRLAHPVYGIAFHPDGARLVSADRQPKKPRLKLWDFAAGKELTNIDVSPLSAYRRVEDIDWGGIRGITISPDGKTLVACGSNDYSGPACALLFDLESGELKRKLSSTLKGFCYAAKYHPQGFLLTASGDVAKGEFRAWNPAQDESLSNTPTAGPCTSLDIHPDSRRLVVTQMVGKGSYPDAGTLTLWEWL